MKNSVFILPLVAVVFGCSGESGVSEPEQTVGTHNEALSSCTKPAVNTGNACDLGNGSLLFQVTLPSGQAYVEVFAEQNDLQNVAQNIVLSESANGDGTSTYSLQRAGYLVGDRIDYRFYSYLPAEPGVFTPGPAEGVWSTYTLGGCETLTVPTDGSSVSSRAYSSRISAKLDISGTVKWGDCDSNYCPDAGTCGFNRYGDAQFHSDNCFTGSDPTYHAPNYNFPIQLLLNDSVLPQTAYNAQHAYSFTNAGTNQPFVFKYADCAGCYGDNSGSFTVTVCAQ